MAEPLGVALLGAGLFARGAYLPLLRCALLKTQLKHRTRSAPVLVANWAT